MAVNDASAAVPKRPSGQIWGAEALWQQLEPLLPGLSIEVVPRCGSTNSELLARARNGQLDSVVLVAEQQTAGRGRNGKAWHSQPGEALLMSLAVVLNPADWSGLSLAVGVAVAEALEPLLGADLVPRIGLKWPNDLWLREPGDAQPGQGRKLAGILIETLPLTGARLAVIGVGVNVCPTVADRADAADAAEASSEAVRYASGRASWQELQPHASPPLALDAVLPALVHALKRFETQGLTPFLPAYARRDVLRGCRVSTSGAHECQGVAQGIGADGALLVHEPSGFVRQVSSGEVSVRATVPAAVVG